MRRLDEELKRRDREAWVGQRVVTASEDNTARLWDATNGKALGEPMRHGDKVTSAQFSPDGQRVVTVSYDKTARLWDAATMTDKDTPERIFFCLLN